MKNLEWYLADLKSTEKNTIETVEKSLTDMFIRLVRIYPCLSRPNTATLTKCQRRKRCASIETTLVVYEPEGVLTTTWGWGGGANAHYIFLKARPIYLGILFLYDSSLETVA